MFIAYCFVFVKTVLEQTQTRKLAFFYNIPVQKISGSVSMYRGTGSGSINTTDEITYWYINENGEGIYDTAPAKSSKIVFLEEDTISYVEICSYCKYKKEINHNNGKEMGVDEQRWNE